MSASRLQRGKAQLVVPQNAVLANNEQRYLWVVEGKPKRRQTLSWEPTPMMATSLLSKA